MPYHKCAKCHHEMEYPEGYNFRCDWCGSPNSIILEEKTPFEKCIEDFLKNKDFEVVKKD